MRLQFYISATLVTLIASCSPANKMSKNLRCKDFRDGTFEMYVDTVKFVIEREGGFQYENSSLGEAKYQVTWLSDCEYKLKLIESDSWFNEGKIGREYFISITATEKKMYHFESRIEGVNFVDKGTLKQIK